MTLMTSKRVGRKVCVLMMGFSSMLLLSAYFYSFPNNNVYYLNGKSFGGIWAENISEEADSFKRSYFVSPEEPFIDISPLLSGIDLAQSLQDGYGNFPFVLWEKNIHKTIRKNKTCAKFPTYLDVHFDNTYWQALKTSTGTFYLYAAYFDNRILLEVKPVIRISTMVDGVKPDHLYCQLWWDGQTEPVISEVYDFMLKWEFSEKMTPCFVSCKVPKEYQSRVPDSVSLVEQPCDTSTTNIRVIHNLPPNGEKKDFLLCVKEMDYQFTDISVKLVEWLELLDILGVDKVVWYNLAMHRNISKVFNYYENINKVQVVPVTLPGRQPNFPGLLYLYRNQYLTTFRPNSVLFDNDCFYQNMYMYKFIAIFDNDEVIIPQNVLTWTELFDLVKKKGVKLESISSYPVKTTYALDVINLEKNRYEEIPSYMHMLQHTRRTDPYHTPKSFHNPEKVLLVNQHTVFRCIGKCSSHSIVPKDALVYHYRSECPGNLKGSKCENLKKGSKNDFSAWRYKRRLIENVQRVLKHLGFLQ